MADSDDQAGDGRRARGAVSRQAMVAAATTLFSSRGYAGTGIAAIAQTAGVNAGSIYHAFGSKEGLLEAVMGSVADDVFATIEDIVHPVETSVGARLDATARVLITDPVFLRLFLLLALEKDGNPIVRAAVERVRARARGIVVATIAPSLPDVPAEQRAALSDVVGRVALILLDGVFVSHQLDSEAADLDETLSIMTAMAELALAQLPGLLAGSTDTDTDTDTDTT